ncbi:MAG: hypothetical protein IKT00_10655 [Prevotella sp.]|nr:hypothetical protein [Prevotella sp.]
MNLFLVRKPRPFHHEMIYQGRMKTEKKEISRLHFATDKSKVNPKRVFLLEVALLALLVVLLAFFSYI